VHDNIQWLLLGGSLCQLLAVFLTSLCRRYYQLFLAQAVLLGVGMAFVTWPPVGVVGRALPNRRGLALGVVVGGSSLGGVVWPIMLERLLLHRGDGEGGLGFGWVMRIVGFTMLPLLAFACATVRERKDGEVVLSGGMSDGSDTVVAAEETTDDGAAGGEKRGPRSEIWTLMGNKVFIFLSLGLAVGYIGMFIPFFYISSYATEKGVTPETSFYLISVLNGASLVGRVLPGHLADRWGHYNLIIAAMFASTVVAFAWTAATSLAGVVVVAVAYGFASGVS